MKPGDRRYFKPRLNIERTYATELLDLFYERILPKLRGRSIALMTPEETAEIEGFAERIILKMVGAISVQNARSWREAASKAGNGRLIYEALQVEMHGHVGVAARLLVKQNAELIRSLPLDIAQRANRYIAAQQLKGIRSEAIQGDLQKRLPSLAKTQIRLIARTETAKAETAFTQARAENIGIAWYQWGTSKDARVRPSHRLMDKVLVSWNEPPAPEALSGEKSTLGHYQAGAAPNCRCLCLPLVRLDEVKWPARVYVSGRIQRISRADFAQIAGLLDVRRRAA